METRESTTLTGPPERSRSKISFTPEGWIFLVILVFVTVGAILRNVNLLVIMSGMMFAPLLLSWRIGSHLMRHAEAKRLVQNRIHVGQIVNFQWMLRNRSRLPMWNFVVGDEMKCVDTPLAEASANSKKKALSRTQATFNYIPIGEKEYVSYRCLFTDRGLYEVGPSVVSTRFPFGLIRCWFRFSNQEQFYVAPRIGSLASDWERRITSKGVGAESALRRRGADEEEFYALRAWRSGDSRRQIHWRTTAKANQLLVKQYDQKTSRDMAIVLDLFARNDIGVLAEQQQMADCEQALSFAATLLVHLGQDVRGKIGLAIAGEQSALHVNRLGSEFLSCLMRDLSIARASRAPQVVQSILDLQSQVSAGTPIFVVSSRPSPQDWLETEMGNELWQKTGKDLHWVAVGSRNFQQVFQPDEQSGRVVNEFLRTELRNAST
ncbi:MAG: DUF58 domain-containing protein [Mariniblastus sp.]|nr:DUF58 domain-containing protein [Mariniblastus sp.]